MNVDPASRCEHGSLEMGCLYCQLRRGHDWVPASPEPDGDLVRVTLRDFEYRIADLERTRAVDAARIVVLEAEGNVARRTALGLESRISVLEAEILEMRTGR